MNDVNNKPSDQQGASLEGEPVCLLEMRRLYTDLTWSEWEPCVDEVYAQHRHDSRYEFRNPAALPASTPPGDACVRHACKRVRMEMQAEVDRLRGLLRRCYTERMTDELDEAIGAAIEGDSHAG